MLPNAFIGQKEQPTADELAAVLEDTQTFWSQLVADMAAQGVDIQEWNSYSLKAGWALRLLRKKRRILYLSPQKGCFQVLLIFGDKAVQAAHEDGLPKGILKRIDEGQRYPEGTAVRIDVKSARDVEVVKKLAALKLQY
jgi:hypothetical protein